MWTITKMESNGQITTETTKSLLWRDAEGRTRQDDIHESETLGETRTINISDPVTRVGYAWNDGEQLDKQANSVIVTHTPGSWQEVDSWPDSPSTAKSRTPSAPGPMPTKDPNMKLETLQPKELNGIHVEGQRTTQVIPAGKEKNDHEVTVTWEKWTSPELKITICSVRDDPHTGRTVIELSNIDRSNPARSLFQPPTDRPMHDVPLAAQNAGQRAR
jgi:hypothetical protein